MKLPEFKDLPEESESKAGENKNKGTKRVVHRPLAVRRPEAATPGEARPEPGRDRQPGPVRTMHVRDQAVPPESHPGSEPRESRSSRGINPGLKLRALEAASRNAPPPKLPLKYRLRPDRELARRAAWDVAAISSLVVNAVLVGVLLLMAIQIRNLKTTLNGLLGGLYGNFVEMDNASIATTITVNSDVQLNFNLPIQQNTDVVLTQNVPIPGARVTINSDLLTINNAPAHVTLPAGTSLPIALNMIVPVQMSVPVSLLVPVNIPLANTELHQPFKGLQNTILPLYCTFNKNAQYPEGLFICAEHDNPTPIPGAP
jgi:hypothetical protein